jgi:uncharacterized integral membrane protein (TIGR00698 family)
MQDKSTRIQQNARMSRTASPAAKPATHAAAPADRPDAGLMRRLLPGVALCIAVAAAAQGLEAIETRLFGRAWLEALVLAILLGTAVRTLWTPGAIWRSGIGFSAKTLLEVAVVLLGVSISAGTILAAGPGLLGGIFGVVGVAILASFGIGRLLGLPIRMALLVACGNSICGNSAIAAVAPVIGADGKDIAASIAFTAVLGVAVVLGLPLLVPLLHLTTMQYGVLAGLTVYAVPQVLAATAPVGALAVQFGTLVKLVRVLMLGPVVIALSLLAPRIAAASGGGPAAPRAKLKLSKLVPWFILGFLFLVALRSLGAVPPVTLAPIALATNLLTVVAMAALGLGTDLKVIARAGGPVTAAVTLSLAVLGTISFALIRLLAIS